MRRGSDRYLSLRPVLPAGALVFIALLLFAGPSPAAAEENVVSIEPFGLIASPGGSFEVAVVTDPPPQTVATWVIFLEFDPAFVTTESADCDALDSVTGGVVAAGCEVVDTDGDRLVDTAKMFGGVIFRTTEQGLSEETVLADIAFDVLPSATGCTFLTLQIIFHTDADANETGARVRDARICSDAAAPPAGTVDPEPPDIPIRTSEPPSEEDRGETDPGDDGDEDPGGEQDNDDGTDDGGATGGPGVTTGTDSAGNTITAATSPGATRGTGSPGLDDDGQVSGGGVRDDDGGDGGVSPVVWVVAALAALGAAGGAAWWVVRSRGASAPGPDSSL